MTENEEPQEDAITMLAMKSKEVFMTLYNALKEDGFDPNTAKEVALALTPKPIDLLSAIYDPSAFGGELPPEGEPLEGEETFTDVEDELPPAEEVPDDEILKGFQKKPEGEEDGKN